ncbi:hypothetical protein GGR56DRAFT_447438 [Xylariaceae sp. FL0804]|nr:hypothetical protein GGR56DRAFT_447438 [Xylariaceae sp. FL0804]
MGNAPSAEASKRGARSAQKLSKTRYDDAVTAGLLNPNDASDHVSRPAAARRLSLPTRTSPVPSPKAPGLDAATLELLLSSEQTPGAGDRSSRSPFRPQSSQDASTRRLRGRSHSVGVVVGANGRRRLSRNSSVRADMGEDLGYRSGSLNTSHTSINYDMTLYGAKRLLNLTEEPSHEDRSESIVSESHFNVCEARRRSMTTTQPKPASGAASPLPRANSDVSMYAPMRRRSFLTPGVATRAATVPSLPSKPKTRRSLPPTPARRDSLEMSRGTIDSYLQPMAVDPSSIPRALTPSEAEYKQTGAFQFGSLRITNGSPAISPAVDSTDGEADDRALELHASNRDYFSAAAAAADQEPERLEHSVHPRHASGSSLNPNPHAFDFALSRADASPPFLANLPPSTTAPEDVIHEMPELQTTSKHTALEDELFEEDQLEFSSSEVIDVRNDPSAKSKPGRPRLSGRRKSKDISRSDSGLVASPISEISQGALSKADSGYSSNISLRSFSSKANGRGSARSRRTETDTPNNDAAPSAKHYAGPTPDVTVTRPPDDESPPIVPEKDQPSRGRRMKASSPTSPQSPRFLESVKSFSRKLEVSSSSSTGKGPKSPEPPAVSSTRSTEPMSPLSIASAPKKPGRLQRILSNTRVPLTVHATHPSEKTGVPPVPQDIQARLREHTGLLPLSFRKPGLRPEASRETLGTIMSVGSAAELAFTDEIPVSVTSGQSPETKSEDWRGAVHAQFVGSTLSRAATSVLGKKAIVRKPVPMRDNTPEAGPTGAELASDGQRGRARSPSMSQIEQHVSRSAASPDYDSLSRTNRRETYGGPSAARLRSASAVRPGERGLDSRLSALRRSDGSSPNAGSPNSLQPPVATSPSGAPRTPPPVSMKNRNMGVLRKTPPPRAQSTPPDMAVRVRPSLSRGPSQEGIRNHQPPQARPTLSRNSSREGVQSYPSVRPSLSRPSSRDGVQSYPPVQVRPSLSRDSSRDSVHIYPPAVPSMVPSGQSLSRKSSRDNFSVLGDQQGMDYRVYPGHGISSSQPPSANNSRGNSLRSQSSQRSQRNPPVRPGWSQQAPPLRHRPSYDEDDDVLSADFAQDNGPYPSMAAANGQAFVSDPWSGRPVPQKLEPSPRQPPYVPRGHSRHRSLDQHHNSVPYRVLHSYNSPAYRNAPIWG